MHSQRVRSGIPAHPAPDGLMQTTPQRKPHVPIHDALPPQGAAIPDRRPLLPLGSAVSAAGLLTACGGGDDGPAKNYVAASFTSMAAPTLATPRPWPG